MALTCNRCETTGFLNLHQINDKYDAYNKSHDWILKWVQSNEDHDVQICDCCGDGDDWYGIPGEHYNSDDVEGKNGPYSYNGGFCECH